MSTNAHDTHEYWGQELARIHARIDEFELRLEAECHVLRSAVDTQIDQIRITIQRMEDDMAAGDSDAYVQRVASQIAELKRKGDAAYDLLEARLLRNDFQRNAESTEPLKPKLPHRQPPHDAPLRTQADS